MKVGLAIAPENASPLAFVVFRDSLEVSMEKVARLGYDGVELALLDASEVDVAQLKTLLARHGLELPVISTGRVFSEGGTWCTHPDPAVRCQAVRRINGLVELAAQVGAKVNIGRVRGFIPQDEPCGIAESRFLACIRECADRAALLGVEILLEPVNRYEINYINSVPDALDVLAKVERPNVKVMPDVFHMNIEDASIPGSLRQAGPAVGYIHLADSNRWAPGRGHLNFPEILGALQSIGYDWWATAEILPHPNPDAAAADAIRYLRRAIGAT